MTTATTPNAVELDANGRLLEEIAQTPSDSPLHRGLSLIARNRIGVGLARPEGLAYLTYGDDDSVENVKEAIRTAAQWMLRVADEAE